ncbi:MAG: diaminopimelate epimerase [Desulfobacterales bacterium]|nr:diaminopimelate epimerase [Desulfobacterales bacterium]
MKHIPFYKMSGSGNDFIIIDNRNGIVDEASLQDIIVGACRRKMSVGADGFILVEDSANADFKWRFFNADGSVAEMCGNGARCVARYAYFNDITGPEMTFETEAGIISAKVMNERVKIQMTPPVDFRPDFKIELADTTLSAGSINTGVPHVVTMTDMIDTVDVVNIGREIRFHEDFKPAGTNVNFAGPENNNCISVRTYERGVEEETLACGTGCVAVALVYADKFDLTSPINIMTRSGGYLTIYFNRFQGKFTDVFLEGDARIIYEGKLWSDAWRDELEQ